MSSEFDVYNDPDVIQAQFGNSPSVSNQFFNQTALGGAITNIGGALGPSVTIAGSSASGFTVSASGVGNTLTFALSVANAATARTSLGLGALAVLAPGTAVANTGTVASAGYVQAEAQAVIDKLNALLNSLRAAGVIAT